MHNLQFKFLYCTKFAKKGDIFPIFLHVAQRQYIMGGLRISNFSFCKRSTTEIIYFHFFHMCTPLIFHFAKNLQKNVLISFQTPSSCEKALKFVVDSYKQQVKRANIVIWLVFRTSNTHMYLFVCICSCIFIYYIRIQ